MSLIYLLTLLLSSVKCITMTRMFLCCVPPSCVGAPATPLPCSPSCYKDNPPRNLSASTHPAKQIRAGEKIRGPHRQSQEGASALGKCIHFASQLNRERGVLKESVPTPPPPLPTTHACGPLCEGFRHQTTFLRQTLRNDLQEIRYK
jgi:hypothetical protein